MIGNSLHGVAGIGDKWEPCGFHYGGETVDIEYCLVRFQQFDL